MLFVEPEQPLPTTPRTPSTTPTTHHGLLLRFQLRLRERHLHLRRQVRVLRLLHVLVRELLVLLQPRLRGMQEVVRHERADEPASDVFAADRAKGFDRVIIVMFTTARRPSCNSISLNLYLQTNCRNRRHFPKPGSSPLTVTGTSKFVLCFRPGALGMPLARPQRVCETKKRTNFHSHGEVLAPVRTTRTPSG